MIFLLFAFCGYGWAFEQGVAIEGVLRRAERTIIKNFDGEKPEARVERSIVLLMDEPLVLSSCVTLGKEKLAFKEKAYSHITLHLPEEFHTLIGKRVKVLGSFGRSYDPYLDDLLLSVETALDCEEPAHPIKTVSYEPEEVEVTGMVHTNVYPGAPDYTSVELGDRPEETFIITLCNPINVEPTKDDEFNEAEKAVRELHVSFDDHAPSPEEMKHPITIKGTLYHAHTAHHHRRVLMMVNGWSLQN